ncbi:cell division protein PerM, partial [Streptacidiphilus griseoplanus]|uniref:cell division protein PerM n=1 Tax=Peterkaempfera griseoplana TaxID=66896 RepID=UPI0006E1B493
AVPVPGEVPGAGTAPVGMVPLLLTAAALFLLFRAGRRAGRSLRFPAAPGPATALRSLATAVLAVCSGYTLVAAGAAVIASEDGMLRARPFPALAAVLALAVPVAAVGVRSATGPWGALLRHPAVRLRALLRPYEEPSLRPAGCLLPGWAFPAAAGAALLRAVTAACAALLGGGALVLGCALLLHGNAAGRTVLALAPDVPGQAGLLLLCLALYPDAAVWAASYALGPGFTVGTGSTVAPYGTVLGDTPVFPLLAALPRATAASPAVAGPLGWSTLAVPALAGVVLAAVLGRAAAGARWHPVATALAAVCAALLTGVAAALGAAASGGALGVDRLASLGPSPWLTGAAAAAWTAAVGVPGVLLARFALRGRAAGRGRN